MDGQNTATPRHNLPPQPTSFIGREVEIVEITSLLADLDVRLLTILAPGGMGKTRLALEVAERQLSNYQDGVCFVPLQPLSNPDHIVPAIATHTGYPFQPDHRDHRQQILDYLANKQMLLVLDTCEHLLDGMLLVLDILQAAPQVTVLATSREKLNLVGETVYSLRGMRFPTRRTPDDALAYDAVKLLEHAARRVKPDWAVTAVNLDDVTRLCQSTDGMPLGILLAASWLDVFNLEHIVVQIERNLDFLETEMRGVPVRQRSIRALFDHARGQLSETEQQAFMKLSVFRGGCTPMAAEAVTGVSPRILQALVHKALLTRAARDRYDLHELLRQYGEAQLEQSGEADRIRDAHMLYYADALHQREAHLKYHRQREALDDIESDFENVRAAWMWAVARKHYDAIQKMVDAVHLFAWMRSRPQDADELFATAIEHLSSEPSDMFRAVLGQLQTRCGIVLIGLRQYEQAERVLRDSLSATRERNDPLELADCLNWLGAAVSNQGRLREARQIVGQALAYFREASDHWGMAWAHLHTGYLAAGLGQPDEAYQHTFQSFELFREIGDKHGLVYALDNLGAIAFSKGQLEEAERYNQDALALYRDIGIPLLATPLDNLTLSAIWQGDLEKAERLARESLAHAREINTPGTIAGAQRGLSWIAEMKGDYAEAYRLAHEGFVPAQESGNWSYILNAAGRLGWALCSLDRYHDAVEHLYSYLRGWSKLETTPAMLEGTAAFAPVLAYRGEPLRAVELLGLVFSHPASPVGMLEKHPRLTALRADLEAELGTAAYHAAWKRGRSLDLDTVVQELLDEFKPDDEADAAEAAFSSRTLEANAALPEPLTERELEVLALICSGLSNREIGEELVVGVSTVRKHINHLYSKLGVDGSRSRAILRAQELGLV